MTDAELIASLRAKIEYAGTTGARVHLDWIDLERVLDLADVAVRYRRLANDRQKKLARAKDKFNKLNEMTP